MLLFNGCDLLISDNNSESEKKISIIFNKHLDITDTENSEASDIINVSNGGYLVAGRTFISGNKPFFLRIDESGNKIWDKIYNGQRVHSVVETPDGGFAATGGGSDGIYVVKSDLNGNLEWEQYVQIPYDDDAHKIILTDSGDLVVACNSYSTSSSGIIFKLDIRGNMIWQYSYDGEGRNMILSLAENKDRDLLIFGQTIIYNYEEEFPMGTSTYWIQKLNSNGIPIYKKNIEHDISSIYRQGSESPTIPYLYNQYLSCGEQYYFIFDDSGNVKKYSLQIPTIKYHSVEAEHLDFNISGNIIIIGSLVKDAVETNEDGKKYYSTFYEPAVFQVSQTGDILDASIVSDLNFKYASLKSVIYNDDGSIVAVGHMRSNENGKMKIWITKFIIE